MLNYCRVNSEHIYTFLYVNSFIIHTFEVNNDKNSA